MTRDEAAKRVLDAEDKLKRWSAAFLKNQKLAKTYERKAMRYKNLVRKWTKKLARRQETFARKSGDVRPKPKPARTTILDLLDDVAEGSPK